MESTANLLNSTKAIDKANYKVIALNYTVEEKAKDLMKKLGAKDLWLPFYCKVVHRLTEGKIQYILEGAFANSKTPQNYFAHAAKEEMYKHE